MDSSEHGGLRIALFLPWWVASREQEAEAARPAKDLSAIFYWAKQSEGWSDHSFEENLRTGEYFWSHIWKIQSTVESPEKNSLFSSRSILRFWEFGNVVKI